MSRHDHVARPRPVPVPPASHLSLLATLMVHPSHTTRVERPEHLDVASQALGYLRSLLAVVGPLRADFRTAFQFHHRTARWGRRSGYQSHGNNSDDASDADQDADEDRLSGRLANQGSLWNRGQDFWSVLGWAMNCSVLHPRRWRYWRTWLAFMLEVMEADWSERERVDLEAGERAGAADEPPVASRQGSIVNMYIDQQSGRRGNFKAMVKALLADGGAISSSAFREVFDREPRGLGSKEPRKRKHGTLDIENDQFGDYLDDDSLSSGASEPPTPAKPRMGRGGGDTVGSTHAGLAESVDLRLRTFRLLYTAVEALGRRGEADQLYDDFSSALKLVPLPLFSLAVPQRPGGPLDPEAHVTLLKDLFRRLLPASSKSPRRVDPEGEEAGALTVAMLRECFAPHAANTVALEDNAKLSLVTESAVQALWACGGGSRAVYSDGLARSVERGIEAREAKTVRRRRTGKARPDPDDLLAQNVLENSSERLRILLGAMEATAASDTD